LSQSRRELTTTINRLIRELEEQRKDLELLISMFAHKKDIFDRLIRQYFRLWQVKSEHDETLVVLPQEEKKYLESELGLRRQFEYYEERIDYAIRRHGELITIDQTLSLVSKIDELVTELRMHLNEHNKGAQEALPKIKDILRKKVGPLLFGTALITVDVHLSSLPTVIAGAYIIYNATVLSK
jgi:uncharacterized membrane-anchored protein YhcB (DUF1043 family)